jgi:hypothetical protein
LHKGLGKSLVIFSCSQIILKCRNFFHVPYVPWASFFILKSFSRPSGHISEPWNVFLVPQALLFIFNFFPNSTDVLPYSQICSKSHGSYFKTWKFLSSFSRLVPYS